MNALSWMSSLSMDSALHVLADNAQDARTWEELLPTIKLHQQLHDAFVKVQASTLFGQPYEVFVFNRFTLSNDGVDS